MKRTGLSLILGLVTIAVVLAQSSAPVGSTIKGFTWPQRNEAGELEANLTGDEARVISVNRTEVVNAKLERYNSDGKVTLTITSPQCDLWVMDHRVSTKNGVRMETPEMIVTAQQMDWETTEKRGVLRHNVRVVLPNLNLTSTLPIAPLPEN